MSGSVRELPPPTPREAYLPQRPGRVYERGTIEEPSKLSNLSERLMRHSRVKRRARPGGLPEMEAENGGLTPCH